MRATLLVLGCLVMTVRSDASAEEQWKLSTQIRHRYENDNRDFNSGVDAKNFNLLRTRLGLLLTPSEDVSAFVQIQDSRTFGEETSTLNDGSADNLDFHQAFLGLTRLFDAPIDLKLGRMEVNLGPQRLIGAVGWSNIGRSFDGARGRIYGESLALNMFALTEVESLMVGDTGDQNVYGAYLDLEQIENHTTQLFVIWQRRVPSESLSRYTVGAYVKGRIGDLLHETEYAYQGGNITVGSELDVDTWMAALNVSYVLSDASPAPKVGVGIDFLKGDGNPTDGKYRVFDTLYATNHKYYGFMDFFLNIPVHTMQLGLLDAHAKLSLSPGEKTQAAIAYHMFLSDQDYTLPDATTTNKFGHEVDLTLKHKYRSSVSFTAGASVFIPDDIFKVTKGKTAANWVYLMTTFAL